MSWPWWSQISTSLARGHDSNCVRDAPQSYQFSKTAILDDRCGAHAFLMQLRKEGQPVPNVELGDTWQKKSKCCLHLPQLDAFCLDIEHAVGA